jgi:hypothetical protein
MRKLIALFLVGCSGAPTPEIGPPEQPAQASAAVPAPDASTPGALDAGVQDTSSLDVVIAIDAAPEAEAIDSASPIDAAKDANDASVCVPGACSRACLGEACCDVVAVCFALDDCAALDACVVACSGTTSCVTGCKATYPAGASAWQQAWTCAGKACFGAGECH